MGLRDAAGPVLVEGKDLGAVSTLDRRLRGIGYIPEDRQHDGMVLSFPLWENVLLGHQGGPPFVKRGIVDRGEIRERTKAIVAGVRRAHPEHRGPGVHALGRQPAEAHRRPGDDRASRECSSPSHPTRGVDVGAQAVIWDILRDARAKGLATLLISADLEELIGLSDRLLVMLRGRVVAELDPASVTPSELGSYMTGANRRRSTDVNRRIVGGFLAPLLAAAVAIAVSSIALLIAGESPATAFSEMWQTIDSTAVRRADHQPRRALLRRRCRRRHRVQDEPVQHRRRRAVPAGRPARRWRRSRRRLPAAVPRAVRVPRRHRHRRGVRGDRRRAQGAGAASTR